MTFRSLVLFFILLFSFLQAAAQIRGTVINAEGDPLPYVNIYPEGSVSGTTTNEKGNYELEISNPGNYVIVFQYLGYRTLKEQVQAESFPLNLDVTLTEESISLGEVVVSSGEDPAVQIMRNAISRREFHKNKIQSYTADFYSRGIWRLENAPEKILGQEVGDLGGSLDSTRSGVIYLSETISKITFKAPSNFRERIVASKVSGNDNGFSLNSAQEATISFYGNTVTFNSELISPLADYGFDYYRYKLEGGFYTEDGRLINKIAVIPKRPKSRTFSGFIYIEENSWQLYGLELSTTGEAMQVPGIDDITLKQNFNFSPEAEMWVPISQTVDFEFGIFGITGNGRFTAVYTNYNFNPDLERKSFTNEILYFEPEANKKDSVFWREQRPVPLTVEERDDYLKKDSIQELRNSRVYLDSVDSRRNRFSLSNLLFGYTYRNSYEKWSLNIDSPLMNIHANTVQGYNSELEISFRKQTGESFGESWRIFTNMEYGFSEEQFRIYGGFQQQFNNISKPQISISGGSTIAQINDKDPISEAINSIGTVWFERNYLKLYDRLFARAFYRQELFNGFESGLSLNYDRRKSLFNNKMSFWIDRDDVEFTSNNPLEPYNYNSSAFKEHSIFRINLSGKVNFGQKYITYPNLKLNIPNEKYPVLSFFYEKGFASDIEDLHFDQLELGLRQEFSIANKGRMGYNLRAGTFFNDEKVSFLDYRHFKGNETSVGTSSSYLDQFLLLPYYDFSTKENYTEFHAEHNFQGWILGRIPGINRLNLNLVAGTHQLYSADRKPYSEFSIGLDNFGIGDFRFLRLDYVVSHHDGVRNSGFVFGLQFLDLIL